MFGDFRKGADSVFRVHTQGSVYVIGLYETRGRKYVVLRGLPGTDREHVVVRDSDPRIGERSLFDVPYQEWPGHALEVATMTTSPILKVERESELAAIASVSSDRSPWARPAEAESGDGRPAVPHGQGKAALPVPAGLSETPRIQPGLSRGSLAGFYVLGGQGAAQGSVAHPAAEPKHAEPKHEQSQSAAAPSVPYPASHVRYADHAAACLRALVSQPGLFDDVEAQDRSSLQRLRASLDDCAASLETLRRRDRK